MGGENTTTAVVLVGDENESTTTSPALKPGYRGGGLKATADTTPGQHATDPSSLPSEGAQGAHVDSLSAAEAALKVPAGHATHAAADSVPVRLE
jgi:hypothetical protein